MGSKGNVTDSQCLPDSKMFIKPANLHSEKIKLLKSKTGINGLQVETYKSR